MPHLFICSYLNYLAEYSSLDQRLATGVKQEIIKRKKIAFFILFTLFGLLAKLISLLKICQQ